MPSNSPTPDRLERFRHYLTLLSAWLFFPEGEPVTPELLEIAKEHAARGSAIHKRMLGLAWYRRGDDEQALSNLEQVAAVGRLTSNSKVTSLLCLALVQLRMEQPGAARESITEARAVEESASRQADSTDQQAWGVIPSLWREVQAAMEAAGLDEPIPELPPAFAESSSEEPATTEPRAVPTLTD